MKADRAAAGLKGTDVMYSTWVVSFLLGIPGRLKPRTYSISLSSRRSWRSGIRRPKIFLVRISVLNLNLFRYEG